MDTTEHNNVILFPKWKKILEKESLLALKEKRYKTALDKLNKLLDYQVDEYEVVTGKLICLMELGHFDEALDFCEDFMEYKDGNYYNYVHIYLTILFQTHQYDRLVDQIEHEFRNPELPKLYLDQFKQLYDMSKKMQLDVTIDRQKLAFDELFQAVENKNHVEQWRQIESLRKLKTEPPNKIIDLLVNERVHPVVKTAIVLWAKERELSQEIKIHKFGLEVVVNTKSVEELQSSEMVINVRKFIKDVEQKDPSFYQLLNKLLYHYAYVIYPIMPENKNYTHIAKALIIVGNEYLNIQEQEYDSEEEMNDYIHKIKMCDTLYLSIIEE